jgi:hypothetical protein
VDVGGTSVVVAREEGVERGDAVVVGGLHPAERRALQNRRVVGVAHAGVALHADIDALHQSVTPVGTQKATATHRRVGTPYVNIGVGHRLAALVVDHLDGQRQGDTALVIRNVLPDLLSLHIWEGQRMEALSRLRLGLHRGP